MDNEMITLNVINAKEVESWLKEITYNDYSPRHDNYVDLIKSNDVEQVSKKLHTLGQIQVHIDATVADVIETAKRLFRKYDQDSEIAKLGQEPKLKKPVIFCLYYPALEKNPANEGDLIIRLGIEDGDWVAIGPQENQAVNPVAAPMTLSGVRSFKHFSQIVWGNETAADPMLLSVLLYTSEDVELAKYIREHFDELHKMSGPRVITYILERPSSKNEAGGRLFWKSLLKETVYLAWNLLGWSESRPYQPADAYEIAKRLGIYPDQLPCLAVFDRTEQVEKIVFRITGDFTTFFRTTYSNIQHALYLGPELDVQDSEKLKLERLRLFNKIRETFKMVETVSQENIQAPYKVYNFYGQTVFINHPMGSIQLQDFQNTLSGKGDLTHE